jgi:hypothetical protein
MTGYEDQWPFDEGGVMTEDASQVRADFLARRVVLLTDLSATHG